MVCSTCLQIGIVLHALELTAGIFGNDADGIFCAAASADAADDRSVIRIVGQKLDLKIYNIRKKCVLRLCQLTG